MNRSVSSFRRAAAEARAILRFSSESRTARPPTDDSSWHVWDEVRRLPRRQDQVIALTYLDGLRRRGGG